MKLYITIILLCFSFLGQSQNMPKNVRGGECYIRCKDNNGEFLTWKKVKCDLVLKENALKIEDLSKGVFNKKDRKTINKKLVKLFKKGYTIELLSHYYSKKSDSINQLRSIQNGNALYSYLQTQGVNTKQLLISAYGNSKPLKSCNNINTCPDYYIKNTRLEYRVVNLETKENVVWSYNNEKKIWCYTAQPN